MTEHRQEQSKDRRLQPAAFVLPLSLPLHPHCSLSSRHTMKCRTFPRACLVSAVPAEQSAVAYLPPQHLLPFLVCALPFSEIAANGKRTEQDKASRRKSARKSPPARKRQPEQQALWAKSSFRQALFQERPRGKSPQSPSNRRRTTYPIRCARSFRQP